MALDAYLKLKGQQTGDIKGGVIKKGREGRIAVIAVSHEIVSPRDVATGQATGKRQHKPFVITKEIDQSSPRLYGALANNEVMTEWELQFWAPQNIGVGPSGEAVLRYTVTLTSASIASIAFRMANNKDSELANRAEYEEIAFTYQAIEWNWKLGNVAMTDNW
ncbi:MAG TPA: type VI secretion system tube protein TssD [Vicinamibacterales bacterium]|nr:type VI secretion system tube protein Hcp [Acidobacteriota bacterium]HQX82926.1 type VI secretion system tube protein TssD [Vicinamibacterales bacterium]